MQNPLKQGPLTFGRNNYYSNYVVNPVKSRLYTDSMLIALKGHEKNYHSKYANTLLRCEIYYWLKRNVLMPLNNFTR